MASTPHQLFYYFTKSKFEYRGEVQFDRIIGPNFFFRPLSVLRWYGNNTDECNDGWCFDQFFSLYQRINSARQAALAYDVELYFRNQPSLTVFDTVFKVRYRQMTPKEWLFWEVEPAVHFPYDYGSDPTFRILAKLEGVFGYNTKVDINDYFTPTEAQWGSKEKAYGLIPVSRALLRVKKELVRNHVLIDVAHVVNRLATNFLGGDHLDVSKPAIRIQLAFTCHFSKAANSVGSGVIRCPGEIHLHRTIHFGICQIAAQQMRHIFGSGMDIVFKIINIVDPDAAVRGRALQKLHNANSAGRASLGLIRPDS